MKEGVVWVGRWGMGGVGRVRGVCVCVWVPWGLHMISSVTSRAERRSLWGRVGVWKVREVVGTSKGREVKGFRVRNGRGK